MSRNGHRTHKGAARNPPKHIEFVKAVAAAIKAYAKTGCMVDAALAYARHGVPVFPVNVRNKKPVARRLLDDDGEPIAGTGGFKRATCDEEQIREWWGKRGRHLIGVPMGRRTGVWALDVDTTIEHDDDGIGAWRALEAEHDAVVTREHRTATDGLHLIFKWTEANPIGCSTGSLPHGIEVKAHGGYIVAPPSVRKGNAYTVAIDTDPIAAPEWLYGLIGRPGQQSVDPVTPAKPPTIWHGIGKPAPGNSPLGNINELAEAITFIPNDWDWNTWTSYGLAIYAATDGSEAGFALFDALSQKSPKYHAGRTRERWIGISASPPDRTGANKLFAAAIANGWKTAPTHALAEFSENDNARTAISNVSHKFFNRNRYQEYADKVCGADTWGSKVDTGLGKTTITAKEVAASRTWIDANGKKHRKNPVGYAVPTHRLGSDLEQQFLDQDVVARIFRGRDADDPLNPDQKMCLALDKVAIAIETKQPVERSCCKYKKDVCPFYDQCGYQRQKAKGVEAWIFATDMIFHRQPAIGKLRALVIDEGFWQKAHRGIEDNEKWELPLASLSSSGNAELRALADVLARQTEDGGLLWKRYTIYAGDGRHLTKMIIEQWKEMPKLDMRPGMSAAECAALVKNRSKLIHQIIFARRVILVLEELRNMMQHEIKISGRLQIGTSDKLQQRVLTWRGVAEVTKQFRVPTLLLDATMPDASIIKVTHPRFRLKADIRVAMPASVRIRQILGTPTSQTKLIDGKHCEKHREEIRRYILQRWFETGRQKSLVITQMGYADWLQGKLPANIAIGHYNAIAGLDQYRDVRLEILIGRPQPGPKAVEALAATLSGLMPDCIGDGERFNWYPRIRRGIRLEDGSGVAVIGERHPDDFCEAIRQQITEAELMQAIGRARAVNRDASSPLLDIDLALDVVLPIVIGEVDIWKRPSLLIDTATQGVMLKSPTDLVRIWPELWDVTSAERTVKKGVPPLPGFEPVTYHLQGNGMKPRTGFFDCSLIPDPAVWLKGHLGPLERIDP